MNTCKCPDVYMVVVCRPTGRAFTLSRSYKLIDHDVANYKDVVVRNDAVITRSHAGWLPSGMWQRPSWAKDGKEADFTAFWLSEPSPA